MRSWSACHCIGAKKLCSYSRGLFTKNIDEAARYANEVLPETSRCTFICDDARKYKDDIKYDKVVCLYDVIGSFPEEKDNLKIITTAYNHLKFNGIFILSVMNMELTESLVFESNKGNLQNNPDIIRKLPPSRIMQSSGDIFNPKYLAIDTTSNLVYRKEQFSEDDGLSAEYIIRDKRYKMTEIIELLELQGFDVIESRYVRAGHFDEPLDSTDSHAKEICLVARKL